MSWREDFKLALVVTVIAVIVVAVWVVPDALVSGQDRDDGRRWARLNNATVEECERRGQSAALDLYDVDEQDWFDGCRAEALR